MLYEKYQRRILKISAVMNRLRRYRILIITAAAVVFALLAGFLSVKGVVYSAGDVPAGITYGEDVSYRARAFFGQVSYEYAAVETDVWSAVQPRHAGTYKVRAVSKRISGSPYYGKVQIYQILPKAVDVVVSQDTVKYGEKPLLTAELMFEDSISCSLFDYTDISQEKMRITADKDSVVITDKDGNDVTGSYSVNTLTRDVTLIKRAITVTVADASAVYDGTPLSFSGYEVSGGSLADGDRLIAAFDKSRIDAGEAENTAQFKIVSAKDIDITGRYEIETVTGKLTVAKRPVYIKIQSAEKIYDGQPLIHSHFTISADTPLVSGHTPVLTNAASLTDAGTCENLPAIKIMNGGEDVTANYSFLFPNDSKLTVVPRNIIIKTDGADKTYDGLPLTNNNYDIVSESKPLDGHRLELFFSGFQTRAGSSKNTVKEAVMTGGDKNVTANYTFEYDCGTLTVSPRALSVRTATTEFIYNGKAQSDGRLEIVQGLVPGQTARAVTNTQASLTNIGTVRNELTAEILDGEGNDVSDSYTVTYIFGVLTIKQLCITITTETGALYYNGKDQHNTAHTISPMIAAGQTSRAAEGALTTLKEVEWLGDESYKEYDNIFSIAIYSGADDVSYNYDISYVYGKIKMLPRSVTVTTASQAFIYNGEYQFNDSYVLDPGIADGHTAQKTEGAAPALREVERLGDESYKEYTNVFEIKIYSGSADVSYNYSLSYSYGVLTVRPRPITIATYSNSWIYDKEAHSDAGFNITSGSLAEGQEINAASNSLTTITDVIRLTGGAVGSIDNVMEIIILNGDGNAAHNYDISYIYGALTVTPRPLTITTNTNSWEYDGVEHFDAGHTVSADGLISRHKTQAADTVPVVMNVIRLNGGTIGSTENSFIVEVFDEEENVTGNYDLSYVYGTLTITPRLIEITTKTLSWIYDGESHFNIGYVISSGVLVSGHNGLVSGEFVIVKNVIRLNDGTVGSKENKFTVDIYIGEENLNVNYDIKYIYGVLTIIPRQIVVKLTDVTRPYDGTPWRSSEYDIISALKLVEGQFSRIYSAGSQTEIGVSDNIITGFNIFSGDEDVTYNYDVTKINGLLNVVRRYINLRAFDAAKIYDGTELTCADFYILGDSLLPGHYLFAVTTGSQTEVGIGVNSIDRDSVRITYINGIDVSEFYNIHFTNGSLHVGLKEITLQTFSSEKEYDGTRLTDKRYEIIGGLLDGHTAYVNVYAWITEVGSIRNYAEVRLRDSGGRDVTDLYIITEDFGTLTVTGDSGGADINLDGTINGKPGSEEPEKIIVFKATSETSGAVYFRIKSFGDYTMSSWNNAEPYASGDINALYLTYLSLAGSGKKAGNIEIEPLSKSLSYMVPYYAKNGYGTLNDTVININYNSPYYFDYISYAYNAGDMLSVNGSGYETFEREYYNYVMKTYLQLPETTRSKLLEIAAKNNLNAKNPSIVSDTANFVKNTVKYNLNPEEYPGDAAVYFFTQAKTGLCRHYATAATAMFRALGIPARYTVGFVGNMSAGKTVEVSAAQAHAWVEIYLSGAGWVQIEVTGSGAGSGAGDGSDNVGGGQVLPETLTIKPVDVYKTYDKTSLFAKNEIEGEGLDSLLAFKAMLNAGYRYTAVVTGSRIEYGISESRIQEFILYDAYGRNVTEKYPIIYKPGRIRIIHPPIYIHLDSLQKNYDGTPLSYGNRDYRVEALPEGMRLDFDLAGSLTDAGIMKLSDFENLPYKIYDKYNNNVTELYSLVFLGEPLVIYKRVVEITSASATKTYDGTVLTNNFTWISKGFFPQNHNYEAIVTGRITDIGSADNVINKIIIYDGKGIDVTKNYKITLITGVLTVKE